MAQRKHLPVRRCIVCGERMTKGRLIRVVRTGTDAAEIDPSGRRPGRGAYLCRRESCRRDLAKRPAKLERALRIALSPDARARLIQAPQET